VPPGAISLTLADGKDYTLHPLSLSGLRVAQNHPKQSDDESNQGYAFLSAIIWQALLPEYPEMTVEQAAALVPAGWAQLDKDGLDKLFAALDVHLDITEAETEADPTELTTLQPA
jgi:hypothetical protein